MNVDVEVFFFGVPNGESFWGKVEDRNYFGKFYDQSSSDKVRFLVQTRRSSIGNTYCYYNYLVYNDIVGNDGRPGSYFGMSIRFDAYCQDFKSVYDVLDNVFRNTVVGNVLKISNGKCQYAISDFPNSANLLEGIKSQILCMLQNALAEKSFCQLKGFNTKGSVSHSANLYEVTSAEVETRVKQYGQIAVSPYYPTNRERTQNQQWEAKLNAERRQCEDRIKASAAASEKRIVQGEKELAALRSENSKLQVKIQQQEDSIKELNGRIQRFDLAREQMATIEQIKEPVMRLASAYGYAYQIQAEERKKDWSSIIKFVVLVMNTILGLIILAMLICCKITVK